MKIGCGVYIFCASVIFTFSLRVEAELCSAEDYKHDVVRKGCTTKQVQVKACLGACPSEEIPIDDYPFFIQKCECCKPVSQTVVSVTLNCDSGPTTVDVPSTTKCECQKCRGP